MHRTDFFHLINTLYDIESKEDSTTVQHHSTLLIYM